MAPTKRQSRADKVREKRREREPFGPARDEFDRFFVEYGSFFAVWASYELVVEVIIMRRLRLSPIEASIVCGGLGFGAKVNILYSLIADGDEVGKKLLRDAQNIAARNDFAHGFITKTPVPYQFKLIRRDVKDALTVRVKPLGFEEMAEHGIKVADAFHAVQAHFGVSDEDLDAYARAIESHSSIRASQAKPRPARPTNSSKANRK